MHGQADLSDHRVLERLLATLEGLPRVAQRALDDAEIEAGPRLRQVAQAVEDARDELRAAERARSDAEGDEDDGSGGEADAVDAAREQLARLETAADGVQEALGEYGAAAADLRDLDRAVLVGARQYLVDRLIAIQAYVAIRPFSRVTAAAGLPSPVSPPDPAAARLSEPTADLPPLPPGFDWIPIAQISRRHDDPALVWNKVAYEVMEAGLRAFSHDLAPRLRNGTASRDQLSAFDEADGRNAGGLVRPDSLANLHDVFFGSDPIAASSLPDGTYSLSSGRHRMEVARRLGWTHVPGRVLRRR